jgi:hypothetical protein
MVEDQKKAIPAAYLPFKTFISSVEALEHGIPRRLDRTIWRGQSGIVQGQIMMAFRFLGLINDKDEPTMMLRELVEKKGDRPIEIRNLIEDAYIDLFNDHDLTKTTPKMLDEAMSQYNVGGDTRRKAVAFFLRAAKYAELPMHPLLAAQTRNASNGVRKKRRPKETIDAPSTGPGAPSNDGSPKEVIEVKLPSGGLITLMISAKWTDMSGEEWTFVRGLVEKLREFGASKTDDAEDEGEDTQ